MINLTKELTRQYMESATPITCEISMEYISNELGKTLLELNKDLSAKDAEWVIRPCETCVSHGSLLHVEIDKMRYI